MSDLTEFLLERIAEDQERAEFVRQQTEGNNWTPHEPWKLSWHDEYDLLCIEPTRALAECEAKRTAIEAAWATYLRIEGEWGSCRGQAALSEANDYPDVIRAFAAVYADHPDFHEEWRRG